MNNAHSKGHEQVWLVGAGCGDPELLTLKAARLIQEADVLLVDHLVSEEILALAPRGIPRISVGKLAGQHTMAQGEIESLMIKLSRQGKRVVRLKGGDPLLFGRGGEEMEALVKAGIPVQVCPGISAGLGCAAAHRIPLTHRGLADRCLFITGRDRHGSLPLEDLQGDLTSCTLVIYMGLKQLAPIVDNLRARGLPKSWPVAIIERGTQDRGREHFTTLGEVAHDAGRLAFGSPSLLIIGRVVEQGRKINAASQTASTAGAGMDAAATGSDASSCNWPANPAVFPRPSTATGITSI